MQAVVFDGTLRVADNRPTPEPQPGEARLWIRLAGICSTEDAELMAGQAMWAEPHTHAVYNTGEKPVRALNLEIKR